MASGSCFRARSNGGDGASGGGTVPWLAVYVASGVALQLSVEFIIVHGGLAGESTFLLVLVGYWGTVLVAGVWAPLRRLPRRGQASWSSALRWRCDHGPAAAIATLALVDCAGSCLDFVAQEEAGPMLFAALHSSVVLFAAVLATGLGRARLTASQWTGVAIVAVGLAAAAGPGGVKARGSPALGAAAAFGGALLHALFFPLGEIAATASVGGWAEPLASPAAVVLPGEVLALYEALPGAAAFTAWTLVHTLPRWREEVVGPMFGPTVHQPSLVKVIVGYAFYAIAVGLHSIAFFCAVRGGGSVHVAVSKGVQQVCSFLCLHILFCHIDSTQCLDDSRGRDDWWRRAQKPAALVACSAGVFMYEWGKARSSAADGARGRACDARGVLAQ